MDVKNILARLFDRLAGYREERPSAGTRFRLMGLAADISMSDVQSESWYTLDGRRLSGKPSQSGIYINNGMKVVIK